MALWRKKKAAIVVDASEARPTPPAEHAVAEDVSGPALDAVAHMLRTYGQRAFDVGDAAATSIRDLCEGWARHILIKAPKPGEAADAPDGEDDAPRPPRPIARDWVGLRHFFNEIRKREGVYVTRSVGDLRETIWTFVHGLSAALSHGRTEEAEIEMQLGKLRKAIEKSSTDDIKREALEAIHLVDKMVAERRKREESQVVVLGERLNQLRSELETARQEMALDSLTGLFNRGTFDQKVSRTVDLGILLGETACLLMIDVDHFKAFNDTHGHPVGDEALRRLALACLRCFPRKDDFVARYGGEEFAAILAIRNEADGARMAERFLENVRALRIEHEGVELGLTISVGMAMLVPGEDALTWVARADRALYGAKQAGRDRLVVAPGPEASPTKAAA